ITLKKATNSYPQEISGEPIPKFEHDGFARVIDERIVTEMISCYPNVTDPECAFCWKFTLR
ncbi:hypothetical protein DW042_20375, partial [Bacteroides xylanisolvens]